MYSPAAKIDRSRASSFWKRDAVLPVPTASELQGRYLTAVFNFVAARIGAGAEAEDVTADVFASAFASSARFPKPTDGDGDDPARAYLFGIARRKLADVYRRRERHPEQALSDDLLTLDGTTPESNVLAGETTSTLRAILADIPEIQAEVLRLKYSEELSLAEIGLVLGKSPGAIAQLLHRARENARRRGAGYFDIDFTEERTGHEL